MCVTRVAREQGHTHCTGGEMVCVHPGVLAGRRGAHGALEVHERLALLAVRVHLTDPLVARHCKREDRLVQVDGLSTGLCEVRRVDPVKRERKVVFGRYYS